MRGISREAEDMLVSYDWPGNVRELQNVIERAVVLGSTDMILPEDLPAKLYELRIGANNLPNYQEALIAAKRDLLEKVFARTNGDCKQAAAILGLNPTYIYRLVNNLKLQHLVK